MIDATVRIHIMSFQSQVVYRRLSQIVNLNFDISLLFEKVLQFPLYAAFFAIFGHAKTGSGNSAPCLLLDPIFIKSEYVLFNRVISQVRKEHPG